MTLNLRRDLFLLLHALRGVLEECDRQGVDSTGYIHYVEAFKVDQMRTPFVLVLRHLELEARKHGDFRYLPLEGDCATGRKENQDDTGSSDSVCAGM